MEALEAAIAELRWVDATMTRFNAQSDIGRANAGAARCWAASYWQASCFFKPANKTFTAGADVVSVFPPGRVPPPLPAPVCEMPEFHGP